MTCWVCLVYCIMARWEGWCFLGRKSPYICALLYYSTTLLLEQNLVVVNVL